MISKPTTRSYRSRNGEGSSRFPRRKKNAKRIPKIADFLRQGATRRAAARLGGISHRTFYTWLDKDPVFRKIVETAEAEAELALLKRTVKEKGGARFILSRRFREDWGDRVDVTVEGEPVIHLRWAEEIE